jgi:hypothetical protein
MVQETDQVKSVEAVKKCDLYLVGTRFEPLIQRARYFIQIYFGSSLSFR